MRRWWWRRHPSLTVSGWLSPTRNGGSQMVPPSAGCRFCPGSDDSAPLPLRQRSRVATLVNLSRAEISRCSIPPEPEQSRTSSKCEVDLLHTASSAAKFNQGHIGPREQKSSEASALPLQACPIPGEDFCRHQAMFIRDLLDSHKKAA